MRRSLFGWRRHHSMATRNCNYILVLVISIYYHCNPMPFGQLLLIVLVCSHRLYLEHNWERATYWSVTNGHSLCPEKAHTQSMPMRHIGVIIWPIRNDANTKWMTSARCAPKHHIERYFSRPNVFLLYTHRSSYFFLLFPS